MKNHPQLLLPASLLLLSPLTALAQTPDASADLFKPRGLHPLDWAMIALYGLAMLAVGWYYSRKQTSTEEYFLGSRSMKSFVVGISIFATLLSTISYLSQPGEMIKYGPGTLWGQAATPIIFLIVGYLLIPRIMKLPITSAYELLESRLGMSVRLLASVIFILTRLVWMALLIYLAARVMVQMLGWHPKYTPYVVMVTGFIAVLYTTLGGLRAVIITDVIQFFLLFGGALLALVLISLKVGGLAQWWPSSWDPHWQHQPFNSFDPHVRVTAVGAIVNVGLWWICTAGADQVAIQRYLATRDAASARKAFFLSKSADVILAVLLSLVGFALLGFFRAHPEALAPGKGLYTNADYLFPHYIANYLPVGVAGLVISAMFAAAMSSLDSGINSIVTVFYVDFLPRFRKQPHDRSPDVRLAKYLVLGIGVAVVMISSLMGKVPGNITEVTNKTNGLFVGPLFGLFFLAMFVPFANSFGAIIGTIYGLAAAALFAYWDLFTGRPALSFQWILAVSLLAQIIPAALFSLLPTKRKPPLTLALYTFLSLALPSLLLYLLIQ